MSEPCFQIPFFNPLENINRCAEVPILQLAMTEQLFEGLLPFADMRLTTQTTETSSAISRFMIDLLPPKENPAATDSAKLDQLHAFFAALNTMPIGIHGESLFVAVEVPSLRSPEPAYIYLCDNHTLVTHYPIFEFPLTDQIVTGHYHQNAMAFSPCWSEMVDLRRAPITLETIQDPIEVLTPAEAAKTKHCHLRRYNPSEGETTRFINMPSLSGDLLLSLNEEQLEQVYSAINADYIQTTPSSANPTIH